VSFIRSLDADPSFLAQSAFFVFMFYSDLNKILLTELLAFPSLSFLSSHKKTLTLKTSVDQLLKTNWLHIAWKSWCGPVPAHLPLESC